MNGIGRRLAAGLHMPEQSEALSELVAGCSERLSSKAAASGEAKAYPCSTAEPLRAARTPQADFINSR
jgi:hypothetical protein